jgi:uncharacterized membrane protein
MPWIIPALSAPLFYCLSNFIDRFLVEKRVRDPWALAAFGGFASALPVGLILLALGGFPIFRAYNLAALFAGGILGELALVPWYAAVATDDASRLSPLFKFVPLFALILAYVFLGERLSADQAAGFALVLAGGIALSIEGKAGGFMHLKRSFWLMMLSSLLFALPGILFKSAAADNSFLGSLGYEFLGASTGSVLILTLAGKVRRSQFISEFRLLTGGTWLVFLLNEIIYMAGRFCTFYALILAPVALIFAVGGSQDLFMISLGALFSWKFPAFIKENVSRKTLILKIAAVSVMLCGIWIANR